MSEEKIDKNVLGTKLKLCCNDPMTGYFRNGKCQTNEFDIGTHTVCAIVTNEFLEFTKLNGNDLITPRLEFNFPGLKEGDKWCLCAIRFKEAFDNNKAPKIDLEATHEKTLEYLNLDDLKQYSI
jgi:uncharacterized protein